MRILHVSDIHASTREALDQDILVAALLTDAEKYAPFDLAIVTGDISFSGQSDEYNLAEELLLTPLRERLGLTPATIVLVPGNHDVDRERIKQVVHQGLLSVRDTASLNRILDDPEQLQMATASMEAWKTFHGGFYTSTSETLQAVSPIGVRTQVRDRGSFGGCGGT
jgi:predicted MPP superfamily phosphohydrolase